ncbi:MULTISPECIES: hypothetical protein [Nonlabens]|uniref:hypothetical protein n=1 Tax=Nonlabens TaxID=363408 RepID=UPI000CF422A8|nr:MULTISPECIES: hypothetical protein [Nonlabens]PQJ17062.1 hypothetical protein BST93_10355 [Nonlabens tegetincola]
MQKILIILLFLSSAVVQSQDIFPKIVETISNHKRITEIDSLLDKPNSHSTEIYSYRKFKREIGLNFYQNRFYLTNNLVINILSENEIVKFGWVSEVKREKNIRTEQLYHSDEEILKFIEAHNKMYDSNFTLLDLEKQMIKEYKVAIDCGIKEQNKSKETKKMLKYVKRKNVNKLNEFLTSFAPELRTLGIIGLLKLGNLSKEQESIVENLYEMDAIVSYCIGHFGSHDDYQTVVKFHSE